MSPKRKAVLVGSELIACNPVCGKMKEKGLPHDSIWIFLAHFIKNLDCESCFTENQKNAIKETFDSYLELLDGLEGAEDRVQKLGQDFMQEVNNLRKSAPARIVREEREFTAELLETISKNLEQLYSIINSSENQHFISFFKKETLQAVKSASDRKAILKIVSSGFDKVKVKAEKNQESIRNSLDNMLVLESHALIDTLTGVFNRRYYDQELPRMVQTFLDRKGQPPCTLLILDIDRFKPVNDTYGHFTGDIVLKRISEIIQKNCRAGIDSPIRLGGDEFALFLVGTTLNNAARKAKIISKEIADQQFGKSDSSGISENDVFGVTVSVGVCELNYMWKDIPARQLHKEGIFCDPENDNVVDKLALKLFKAADSALYSAKEAGRNQVFVHRSRQKNSAS